jgi:hypothetical protein
MDGSIGRLHHADEGLNHQIVDTFATVSESDLAWTEKVWGSLAAIDGSLQIGFGLGKYANRGVMDGFAAVSRGRSQWTVRASRDLSHSPEDIAVGPIRYEVIEPLQRVRFVLEPNAVQPISFDVELAGVLPPSFEDRNLKRNRRTGRIDVNVIRYHQGGWATGTVTVDGVTHTIAPDTWFGYRDHSWGVRQAVGAPVPDLRPTRPVVTQRPSGFKWSPMFLRRPDGSHFEMAIHAAEGIDVSSAHLVDADGRQEALRRVTPQMRYDPRTRFVLDGELVITTQAGDERRVAVERVGDCGIFLKLGGYGPWKGHKHGTWMGPLVVDGEHIEDCWDDEHLPLLGQLRDTPIRVSEGDAHGFGIMESMMYGEWPDLGLTAESDHRVEYS